VVRGREFSPAEALSMGFLNQLVGKPQLGLLATKAHTNAVTESMVGTGRSWADADGLEAGLRDPAGREVRRRYLGQRR
jgi:hypothetical protein